MKPDADITIIEKGALLSYAGVSLPGAVLIPLGALRARLNEIPKDKEIITFCKISLRGYEAALILKAAGFKDVKVLDGGVVMWPYDKEIS
jgi:rhodanese-related sulfurtransferase